MKNIGFTGLTGMLGHNFYDFYVENRLYEQYRLICLTRNTNQNYETGKKNIFDKFMIESRQIDYNDKDSIYESIKDIDILIHAAGCKLGNSYEEFKNGNFDTTKNLMETIIEKKIPLQRFIFISSQSALGPSNSIDNFLDEDAEGKPVTSYGKTKKAAEDFIKGLDVPYYIIRLPSLFGKYDKDALIVFRLASKGILLKAGWGTFIISYLLAFDAAYLLDLVIKKSYNDNTKRRTLNLCYDDPIDSVSFMRLIQSEGNIKKKNIILSIPKLLLVVITSINTFISKLKKDKNIISVEKVNEFLNNFWLMSNKKTKIFLNIDKIERRSSFKDILDWYKLMHLL